MHAVYFLLAFFYNAMPQNPEPFPYFSEKNNYVDWQMVSVSREKHQAKKREKRDKGGKSIKDGEEVRLLTQGT